MTFLQLYGTELDRELGSDKTTLFTTVARKAAINAGQLEWVKRTECFLKRTTIPLVDETQEYDIEATVSDFGFISKQGLSIKIVSGTNTRYIEGDDLQPTTIERLNHERPGWRADSASQPECYYLIRDGGSVYLGLHPMPSITVGDTWTVLLPYVVIPPDMVDDDDEPFDLTGSNPVKSLRFWHRALVHFAAYDLEKLRKDVARSGAQLQLFEAEVLKFTGIEKPKQGQRMRLGRNYRQRASTGWQMDPRRN